MPTRLSGPMVIGVARVAAGVVGVILLVRTIEAIAHQNIGLVFATGLATIVWRVVTSWCEDALLAFLGARERQRARAHILSDVTTAPLVAPVETASAFQRASLRGEAPTLEAARFAVRGAPLLLFPIAISGGPISALLVVALGAASIPLYRYAGARTRALEVPWRERTSRVEEQDVMTFAGSVELRGLGALTGAADALVARHQRLRRDALSLLSTALSSSALTDFVAGVAVGLVAMVCGFALMGGRISLFRALLAVLLSAELFSHLRRYGTLFHRRADLEAALLPEGTLRAPALSNDIIVNDVTTSFLSHTFSLRVTAHTFHTVRAPSGTGKSTVAAMISGFLSPVAGTVSRPHTVAYIGPSTQLFPGTIRQNLAGSRHVDDDELRQLLSTFLLSHISLDDPVEHRVTLSSGEVIRLLCVRALVHEAGAVIFDDVAGLVDSAARAAIVQTLLARRLTTLEFCAGDSLRGHVDEDWA